MFKKIVLFFTVIFLALPVFADETDIIPVMWLFNDLNFQTIYELKLSTESPKAPPMLTTGSELLQKAATGFMN